MSDPTLEEMRLFLNQYLHSRDRLEEDCEFARECAIYWYAQNNHSGQSSNLYSAMCQSLYIPSPIEHAPKHSLPQELYEELKREFEPPKPKPKSKTKPQTNDMNDQFVQDLLFLTCQLQSLGAQNHEILHRLRQFKHQLETENHELEQDRKYIQNL